MTVDEINGDNAALCKHGLVFVKVSMSYYIYGIYMYIITSLFYEISGKRYFLYSFLKRSLPTKRNVKKSKVKLIKMIKYMKILGFQSSI